MTRPKLDHDERRGELISICRRMNTEGINQGTSGNASVRVPGGFLITPSGIPYESLRPDQIVFMDLEGGYYGNTLPSSEWRMHSDIYRSRHEAGAVVHSHSTYATALSCLGTTIPAFHYMVAVAGGTTIRCSTYATFGTRALSDAMLAALAGRSACLLGNHGLICFGETLGKALWRAIEVETLAKQYWIACQHGDPTILSDEEMEIVLERFRNYGKQADELSSADSPAFEVPVRRNGDPQPARRK